MVGNPVVPFFFASTAVLQPEANDKENRRQRKSNGGEVKGHDELPPCAGIVNSTNASRHMYPHRKCSAIAVSLSGNLGSPCVSDNHLQALKDS